MQDVLGNHIPLTLTTLLTAGCRSAAGFCSAGSHVDQAPSGLSGYSDLCRAGISRGARRYLVLARRPERPSAVRGAAAQSGNAPHHEEPKMREQINKLSLLTQDLVLPA